MATLRSEYSFEQFETVLQRFAHEIAMDAVQTLSHGRVQMTIDGRRFILIDTEKFLLRFGSINIGFWQKANGIPSFGFDIEEKLYATSNHQTKIAGGGAFRRGQRMGGRRLQKEAKTNRNTDPAIHRDTDGQERSKACTTIQPVRRG
jgi:hypothetical protein